jgi:hypothetical protein
MIKLALGTRCLRLTRPNLTMGKKLGYLLIKNVCPPNIPGLNVILNTFIVLRSISVFLKVSSYDEYFKSLSFKKQELWD